MSHSLTPWNPTLICSICTRLAIRQLESPHKTLATSFQDTYNLNAVMLQEILGALLSLLDPETTAFFTLILTEKKEAPEPLSVNLEMWVYGYFAFKK